MECEREHDYLLYLWGEMEEAERAAFVRHLEDCPACRRQVKQMEPLVESMRSMEAEALPGEVARRVSGLVEAGENRPRTVRFGTRRVLAVAASIVLVVGVSILWLSTLKKSAKPGRLVETTKPLLSDDDYIEALALVLISEPDEAGDVLSEAIEEVSYQIEELSEEIGDDFEPIEPSKSGLDTIGFYWGGAKS